MSVCLSGRREGTAAKACEHRRNGSSGDGREPARTGLRGPGQGVRAPWPDYHCPLVRPGPLATNAEAQGLRPEGASEVTPAEKEVADHFPPTPPRGCHQGAEAHAALPVSCPQWAPWGSGSAPGERTDLPGPGRGCSACESDPAGPRHSALNSGEADLLASGSERRDRGSLTRGVCRNGDQGGGCKFR